MKMISSQTESAYLTIREMLVKQQINKGYPLIEAELAEQLNMSRTPVREALLRLQSDGLLERVTGKGLFVKVLNRDEVLGSYEYVESVESMICYLLAQNITPEGLQQLEKHLLDMEKAVAGNDFDNWAKADTLFHKALLENCSNPFMVAGMEKTNILIRSVREGITRYVLDKEKSVRDHRAVYEAIKEGDPEKARAIWQKHICGIRNQLKALNF